MFTYLIESFQPKRHTSNIFIFYLLQVCFKSCSYYCLFNYKKPQCINKFFTYKRYRFTPFGIFIDRNLSSFYVRSAYGFAHTFIEVPSGSGFSVALKRPYTPKSIRGGNSLVYIVCFIELRWSKTFSIFVSVFRINSQKNNL